MSGMNPERKNQPGVISDPDRPPIPGQCAPDESTFQRATGATVDDQIHARNDAWQAAADDAARQPVSLPPSASRFGETPQGEKGVRGMVHQKQQELQDRTRETWGKLRQQGQERVESQKERLVEGLAQIRDAARAASEKLRTENKETAASYSEAFASQLDRSADYLRNRDVGQITRDIRDWGRSRPGLVVGSLFFAGLAISRFLKATDEEDRLQRRFEPYRPTEYRGDEDRAVTEMGGPLYSEDFRRENFGESPTADEPLGGANPNPQAGSRSAGGSQF